MKHLLIIHNSYFIIYKMRRLYSPDPWIVAVVFLFAFGLRVYGVSGSLPYVAHPDEPNLVDVATHMVKSGDLSPHMFLYPTLLIYLQALVIRAYLLWSNFTGNNVTPQS